MPPTLTDTFTLSIEASDFPAGSPRNGTHTLTLTWADLVSAAVTVGKYPAFYLQQRQWHSLELQYKALSLNAFYTIDTTDGTVVHTDEHQYLDASEKAALAFQFGMAMCQLYARHVLGVPWMMHVSRVTTHGNVLGFIGDDRPDLYGLDAAHCWTVAEAKGRISPDQRLIDKMQRQKLAVATVNGRPPVVSVASVTRLRSTGFDLRVVDPPAPANGLAPEFNEADWIMDYYAPVLSVLGDQPRRPGEDLVATEVPLLGWSLALPEDLHGILHERSRQDLPPAAGADRPARERERRRQADEAFVADVSGALEPASDGVRIIEE